jgi:DNA processing protein
VIPSTADVYWLALRHIHGAGPRTIRLLLEKLGSAEQIFKASEEKIAACGVPRGVAHTIVGFDDFSALEKELCELPRLGARLLRWTDADYPPNLRHIADPPPYLLVRGTLTDADTACVAVVGARAASEAGLRMAQRLGLELAARGFIVVSGLARGIDAAAHRGALDAGGRTVGVLGCGIDVAYPPEHRKLADEIVEQRGAILSELPLGTPPLPENFPGRNRILSGLSLGVVVVEAAEKSGSLITARQALEQDRQVFAVPGSPLTGKTRGSNRLLREGAVLVECVEDVIEDLAPQMAGAPSGRTRRGVGDATVTAGDKHGSATPIENEAPAAAGSESVRQAVIGQEVPEEAKRIFNYLSTTEKLHIDAIIESCHLSPQTVLRLLLELELKGLVVQHPGKLFSLP